jgi:phosphoribosylaminoimidazole-succinocarboxamide synthase
MDDAFVNLVSERYIELYESITGQKFERAEASNVLNRVERNIQLFIDAYYR